MRNVGGIIKMLGMFCDNLFYFFIGQSSEDKVLGNYMSLRTKTCFLLLQNYLIMFCVISSEDSCI